MHIKGIMIELYFLFIFSGDDSLKGVLMDVEVV